MVARRVGTIGLWVIQVLLAAQYVLAGQDKFFAAADWARRFGEWGYPDRFFYLIGGLELVAGLLIVIPRWAGYAAGLIVILMTGATITHLRAGDGHFYGALIPLMLAAVVFWARRPARVRPLETSDRGEELPTTARNV